MSPIDYIEEGIKDSNWKMVCEGFEKLTGKVLEIPSQSVDNNKVDDNQAAMQLIFAIHDMTSSIPNETTLPAKKKKKRAPKKMGKNRTIKKTSTVTDSGEDSSLELDESKRTVVQRECGETQLITGASDPEEIAKNKIIAEKARRNKLQLTRPDTSKTYDVKCNECENTFKSDRPDGSMGQKCRKCLSDKKSQFVQ